MLEFKKYDRHTRSHIIDAIKKAINEADVKEKMRESTELYYTREQLTKSVNNSAQNLAKLQFLYTDIENLLNALKGSLLTTDGLNTTSSLAFRIAIVASLLRYIREDLKLLTTGEVDNVAVESKYPDQDISNFIKIMSSSVVEMNDSSMSALFDNYSKNYDRDNLNILFGFSRYLGDQHKFYGELNN